MSKIRISNFGPVGNAELDLEKDIQVIIGSQASGKSTICRMIYFCQKVRDYILDFLMQEENFKGVHENNLYTNCLKYLVGQFMGCFGKTLHMKGFSADYAIDEDKWMKLFINEEGLIRFRFSSFLEENLRKQLASACEVHRQLKTDDMLIWMKNREYMRRQIAGELETLFANESRLIYIPAGRSLLATLSEHLVRASEANTDLLMQEFCQRIERTKLRFGAKIPEMLKTYVQTVSGQINNMALEEAYRLIKLILKADYANEGDGEKIYYDDYHYVKLLYASSGQHEALWILMLCYLTILENRKTFLIVEEPEAHLFPEAQRWIVSLLALTANASKSKVMITTHSPYILTSMNVLLLSGKIEKRPGKNPQIVPKSHRLSSVAAFKVEEHGTEGNSLFPIMDTETNLIEPDYIDSVSGIINEEFDRLLDEEGAEA